MTVSRIRRFVEATALVLIAGTAWLLPPVVEARDFRPARHGAGERHHPHDQVGGNGLPSILGGIGTYAGSISALRVRGNGIYFAVEGLVTADASARLAPRAKIIAVKADTSACSMEAGVCVVRGR